jgi:hypothetical protein
MEIYHFTKAVIKLSQLKQHQITQLFPYTLDATNPNCSFVLQTRLGSATVFNYHLKISTYPELLTLPADYQSEIFGENYIFQCIPSDKVEEVIRAQSNLSKIFISLFKTTALPIELYKNVNDDRLINIMYPMKFVEHTQGKPIEHIWNVTGVLTNFINTINLNSYVEDLNGNRCKHYIYSISGVLGTDFYHRLTNSNENRPQYDFLPKIDFNWMDLIATGSMGKMKTPNRRKIEIKHKPLIFEK